MKNVTDDTPIDWPTHMISLGINPSIWNEISLPHPNKKKNRRHNDWLTHIKESQTA